MNLARSMSVHRPEVILGVLSLLSLASLASGTSASIIHRAITRVVSVTAYPVLEARTAIEEGVKYAGDFIWQYETLQKESEQNKEIRSELQVSLADRDELTAENRRLRGMLNFARSEPRFTLVPVRIIENLRGMLTIDRGRAHGIEPRMGVITEHGVVGIVTEVQERTASVATLHHQDCRIAAMVYRNRKRAYDGVVKAGTDYNYVCSMGFIDMKNEVRPGDILVTNPESVFPAGIPVGTVSGVRESPGAALWKSAEVKPAVDPYSLDEAFVVSRYVPEAEYFTGSDGKDTYRAATSLAPGQPDERPIQERFAP